MPLILALLISSYFYDVSVDGQAYHQEALIQLKQGWNPYWQYLPDSVNQAIWVNHYAKGMETIQAAIYCTFHDIEVGKATNMVLWIGSFFLTLSFLSQIESIGLKKGILISGLLASSPTVLNQLLTYYVDGALASSLLILSVLCVYIIKKATTFHLLLLSLIIILLINIKFTGILYVCLSLGGFLLWLLVKKSFPALKKLLLVSVIAGFAAIVVGYNPYVTNSIKYHHPLHPLMGSARVDIMKDLNTPAGFNGKSGLERFLLSTFAHTNNLFPSSEEKGIPLKVPFTFNKIDVVNAARVDARLGGFGPFFSGILLLSLGLFCILFVKARNQAIFNYLVWFIALIILSVIIMPESWWARYVPQFWFIPPVLLLAGELLLKNQYTILKRLIYASGILNMMFSLIGIFFNITLTELIKYDLDVFKASGKTVVVDWQGSASNRIRFIERGIPYEEQDLDEATHHGMTGSEALFIKSEEMDNTAIQKSVWLRLTEKWLPNTWRY
ncbi:hypothetical protein [Parapedobacter koreensis]|uniref:hypothetical protein n=1 Tax=Parapedobacter koreensis TaxID=332977 RepID=UPI0015A6233C|nr:hypothetical protein [Parapedobacter koreensis]